MTEASPLQPESLWHTGIVVGDLDASMAELGDRLGVTWHRGGGEVRLRTPSGSSTVRAAYALSREGPHHIELCAAVPGTVWHAAGAGQPHHLGYWTDDVSAASAALEAAGLPVEASVAADDDAPPMCAYHRASGGLLVEVVAASMRRVLLPEPRRGDARGAAAGGDT